MRHGEINFAERESIRAADGNVGFRRVRLWQSRLAVLALAGNIFLIGSAAGWAKDKTPQTRTVRGVTTDEADHIISGAAIQLVDLQTKKVLDIYSDSSGQYEFTDLRFDHDYTVKATFKNLASEARQVSSLDIRTPLEVNLILRKPEK